VLREAFQKIFWGWILVFIEIHIIAIDILPDPIGYFLIYSGLLLLIDHFDAGTKAKNMAALLMLVSIPTIFIQNGSVNQMGNGTFLSGWSIYLNMMGIFNLILAYFIFQLLIRVASQNGNQLLLNRTNSTFKLYMISMLVITFFQPFAMNFSRDLITIYIILSSVYGLILQIIFLILIRNFSRKDDSHPPVNSAGGSLPTDDSL
jgi:hypothetical protein